LRRGRPRNGSAPASLTGWNSLLPVALPALLEIGTKDGKRITAPRRRPLPARSRARYWGGGRTWASYLLKSKQYDKAAAEAMAILEKDPKHVGALVLLGDVRAGQGNCTEAVTSYDAALAIEPANAGALGGKQACGAAR